MGELLADVMLICYAVVLGGKGNQPHDDILHRRLAAAVAVPVRCSECQRHPTAELMLAAHEYPVPGDEGVIENDQCVGASVGVQGRFEILSPPGGAGAIDNVTILP